MVVTGVAACEEVWFPSINAAARITAHPIKVVMRFIACSSLGRGENPIQFEGQRRLRGAAERSDLANQINPDEATRQKNFLGGRA
jgi:hypothetical protein